MAWLEDFDFSGSIFDRLKYFLEWLKNGNTKIIDDIINDISFEDFIKNYCDYEWHINKKMFLSLEDIDSEKAKKIRENDKYIYDIMCKFIFNDIKEGNVRLKQFIHSDDSNKTHAFNFSLLNKDFVLSKNVKEILTQFFINPFNKDLIDIDWKNYNPYKQSLHEILLENFKELDKWENDPDFINPNFSRANWLIDLFCDHILKNYDREKIGINYDENGITKESELFLHELFTEFFDYFLENISNYINEKLDYYFKKCDGSTIGVFDYYVFLIAKFLYDNQSNFNISKIIYKFSSEKFDQSAKLMPENYTLDWLSEQWSMAFSIAFDQNISLILDDSDYDFMKSKSEDREYLWFIRSISKWVNSSEISNKWSVFDRIINRRDLNSIIDEIEDICMNDNSRRVSAFANYCSQKISELLFKQSSSVLEFDDFDSEYNKLLNKEEYTGLKHHMSKKIMREIDENFIKSEMDYVNSIISKFVNDNKVFLENLKITDLFILYKFYRQIFDYKIPEINEKYKKFKIKYIEDQLEELKSKKDKKSLDGQKSVSEETKKPVSIDIPNILRIDDNSDSEFNFSLWKKELEPKLIEELDIYFNIIDPNSWKYKEEIIEQIKKIKSKSYRRKYFSKWPTLQEQFFQILETFKYSLIEDNSQSFRNRVNRIDSQTLKEQEVSTVSDWEPESQNLKARELLWTINEQSSDDERINVYINILKELWYEFYRNNENSIRKKLKKISNSNSAFKTQLFGMFVGLVNKSVIEGKITDKKWEWLSIYSLDVTWSFRILVLKWKWKKYIYDVRDHDDYDTFLWNTA